MSDQKSQSPPPPTGATPVGATISNQSVSSAADSNVDKSKSDKTYSFIPKLECGAATNGVVRVTVTNVDDLFAMVQDESMVVNTDYCLEIKYHSIDDHVVEIMAMKVSWAEIGDDGTLFLKVPVNLKPYNFQFSISGIHHQTGEAMTESPMQIVPVPSFLRDNHFSKGEIVSFREQGTFHTIGAEILEVLEDNMFTVKYLEYDTEKNGDRMERDSYNWSTTNVHISRLYHDGTEPQNEIDLVNYSVINQCLLLRTEDEMAVITFDAIRDALHDVLYLETFVMYEFLEGFQHWRGINDFVSYEIFQFLFAPQFKFAVDCLIDGDAHHALEMRNMRQSDIRTKYQLMKFGEGNVHFAPSMHDRMEYACDWCRCAIKEWDMVFQCTEAKCTDRHDFCKRCVGTVVMQNTGLMMLLWALLKDDLIEDCVEMIVSFVIGRVIHTEFADVDHKECNDDDAEIEEAVSKEISQIGCKRKIVWEQDSAMEETLPSQKRMKMVE